MKKSIELSKKESRIILALSLPSAIFISISSIAGILIPGTYFKETTNWALQSMGQDLVNIFLIVPVMIIASIAATRKNKIGFIIWGGVNLYLIYTYVIYCFDIHFNRLFLLYCIVLGLSFYVFIYFIYLSIKNLMLDPAINREGIRFVAGYFLIVSCMFLLLWLSQIVPSAILHTVPAELVETGLVTNPVHVLDLAVFLPGLFITSVLLSRKNSLGFLLAPVLLVFSVLMSFTILFLIYIMRSRGIETSYTVVMVMSVLTIMGTVLFYQYLKSART